MINIKLRSHCHEKFARDTYLRLFRALSFLIVDKNEAHGAYQNHRANPALVDVELRRLLDTHKIFQIFFLRSRRRERQFPDESDV